MVKVKRTQKTYEIDGEKLRLLLMEKCGTLAAAGVAIGLAPSAMSAAVRADRIPAVQARALESLGVFLPEYEKTTAAEDQARPESEEIPGQIEFTLAESPADQAERLEAALERIAAAVEIIAARL